MRAARIDKNQTTIVKALRQCGISVHPTHNVHNGFPDIVAGHSGINYLFEIKDPQQPPSKRKLTKMEDEWHKKWNGSVHTIETYDEALDIIYNRKEVIISPI